jgi:hypothetical protein
MSHLSVEAGFEKRCSTIDELPIVRRAPQGAPGDVADPGNRAPIDNLDFDRGARVCQHSNSTF